MKKILLASASPRRSQLLEQCGIPFEVMKANGEESEEVEGEGALEPSVIAERIAEQKLGRAVAASITSVNYIVLCADTIVVAGCKILGKPADAADASGILRTLSGREHEVITGVALEDIETRKRAVFHERTTVVFRDLDDSEIEGYVASGEPFDKAGAYGIQGLAGAFVTSVRGCYSNVVGLPLGRLVAELKSQFSFEIAANWKK